MQKLEMLNRKHLLVTLGGAAPVRPQCKSDVRMIQEPNPSSPPVQS